MRGVMRTKAEPQAPPALPRPPAEVNEDDVYAGVYERDTDVRYEYLDGRLFVREAASLRHEQIFSFLNALFRVYCEERGGALAIGSHYAMRLDARWSPEPDLLVLRPERRHLAGPKRLEGPADLVIEIVRESDPGYDVRLKLPRYRQARVPEIWTIDPLAQLLRMEVWEPNGYRLETLSGGRLAPTVLPGFWLDLAWLWQDPPPSVLACLRQILA
jgi:Uma2 family endonuclease